MNSKKLTAAQQPVQEGGGKADKCPHTNWTEGGGGYYCERCEVFMKGYGEETDTAPPSAPVGVEAVVAEMREWVRVSERQGHREYSQAWRTVVVQEWAYKLEALTQQPAQAAPGDDCVPIPRAPTEEMLRAFWHVCNGGDPWTNLPISLTKRQLSRATRAYYAMLAAAPTPPGDDAAGGA